MVRRLARTVAVALLAAGLIAAGGPTTAAAAAPPGSAAAGSARAQPAPPVTLAGQVRGGDILYGPGGTQCIVGFTVVAGFLANSACGPVGGTISTAGGVAVGQIVGSSYPGIGYAHVRLNPGWVPVGQVRIPPATFAPVAGSTTAPIGSNVCRAGPISGWRCGTIQAINQTVAFPGGTVSGVTRTNICPPTGELGAPYLSGGQAQGIHAGGSGNCTTGGTSWFLPIRPALVRYGVTLLAS